MNIGAPSPAFTGVVIKDPESPKVKPLIKNAQYLLTNKVQGTNLIKDEFELENGAKVMECSTEPLESLLYELLKGAGLDVEITNFRENISFKKAQMENSFEQLAKNLRIPLH